MGVDTDRAKGPDSKLGGSHDDTEETLLLGGSSSAAGAALNAGAAS